MSARRRLARSAALLSAMTIALVLLVAPSASAHATVVSTSPGDGSILTKAPAEVSVVFDEQVEIQPGALVVYAPDGHQVASGNATHVRGHPDSVMIELGAATQRGTYTAAWRVVSADSHPVSGGFTFSVGIVSATSVTAANLLPAGSLTVGALFGIARWLGYLGFAVLVGTIVFLFACWPAGAANRRIRLLIQISWALLFAATVASLLLQGPYGAGTGVGHAFSGSALSATLGIQLGKFLVARILLLLLVIPLLVWLIRRSPSAARRARRSAAAMGGAFALGLAATWSAADHSGVGIQVPLALPVDMAHLVAMAVWVGGLVVLSVIVLPEGDPETVAVAVPRFSPMAFGAVVVLALTGTYQAWRQVGTLPAFTATAYGRLLLIKIVCFLLLICLGYSARRWIARYLSSRPSSGSADVERAAVNRLRWSVGVEVVVAAGVLALTAVLVNAQPARAAYVPPIDASVPFDTGGPGGDGTVSVQGAPARAGDDSILFYIRDANHQLSQMAEVDGALLLPAQQLGPLPIVLTELAPGTYSAIAPFPIPGAWQLQLTIRSDAIDETTISVPVQVR